MDAKVLAADLVNKLIAVAPEGPVAILKKGIEEVGKVSGLSGQDKQALLKNLMDGVVTHKDVSFDTAAAVNTLISSGLLGDTVSLIIDASKGKLDINKVAEVIEDVKEILPAAKSALTYLFSLFKCCATPPKVDESTTAPVAVAAAASASASAPVVPAAAAPVAAAPSPAPVAAPTAATVPEQAATA